MNNRNQQTNHTPAPAAVPSPTYLNVFTVEEYEANGKTQKKWTRIGAAFPHKEGSGFSIEPAQRQQMVARLRRERVTG